MRQRTNQLGVSEPQIQTTGSNQITVGLPNGPEHRARRSAGRHDREARVLRLGGQCADAQWKARRQPAPDPGPERALDQPGPGRFSGPRFSRRRQHVSVPGRAARRQAAGEPGQVERARRARVLRVWQGRLPGLRDRRARLSRHPACGPALLSGGPAGHDQRPELRPAGRGVRLGGGRPDTDDSAGLGGAASRVAQGIRQHPSVERPERSVLRAARPRRPVRERDLEPAAVHRPGRLARRHVRVHRPGRQRVPERHVPDRPPRRSRQRPGADAEPALRRGARHAADHGPVHRLQAEPRRDPGW